MSEALATTAEAPDLWLPDFEELERLELIYDDGEPMDSNQHRIQMNLYEPGTEKVETFHLTDSGYEELEPDANGRFHSAKNTPIFTRKPHRRSTPPSPGSPIDDKLNAMKRATVTIPEDLQNELAAYLETQESPPTLTALVQAALRRFLAEKRLEQWQYRPPRRRLSITPATAGSGRSDVSIAHDEVLAETR